jgi:hypothetical protein
LQGERAAVEVAARQPGLLGDEGGGIAHAQMLERVGEAAVDLILGRRRRIGVGRADDDDDLAARGAGRAVMRGERR